MNKQTDKQTGNQQLLVSVKTFDVQGKTIGGRIVDQYHYGTRNWIQTHLWWAMHNGNCVEINIASEDEIAQYLANGKQALVEKFNSSSTDAPIVSEAVRIAIAA